ncbi:uncharacterized protein LOC128204986 [Mya arenaria]|uniref:uncharacterized protein LOC128204986 n=1 Tax=Mya arenaria TaxID=6604 RepID=UPI0022DFF801|nr:uncharacterized protein LOC128204986 [Mya arenaria]
MVVIGTDVINKATIVRKFQNAAECSGMTHIEAIGHACAQNDTQPHILLNMDDHKVCFFTSLSSQQATETDPLDIFNYIGDKCLKQLQRQYTFKQNDKRDGEINNVSEQLESKLLTFNGDEDIHISVLDSCYVSCANTEGVDVIEVPKAVVNDMLCKEIEDYVLAAFTAYGFTEYAVFHLYGASPFCLKLQTTLPNTLGDNITIRKCVIKTTRTNFT